MFKVIVETQWKWTRLALMLAVLVAFALPLLSLRVASQALTPKEFIAVMQAWGVAYAFLAGGVGLQLGILAWAADHRGRHIYALTLPVPRWKYALMRYGAGALLLLLPIAALLVASLLASASSAIPAGLHAYPLALTLRFGFAALVAYSIFFAIASSTGRTAGFILGGIGVLIVIQVLISAAGSEANLVGRAADVVFVWPGMLSVFSGRWMLIDV